MTTMVRPARPSWRDACRVTGRIQTGRRGPWEVRTFEVGEHDIANLRLMFQPGGRSTRPGTYTQLVHDRRGIVMSDTDAELRDLSSCFWRAPRGRILVNGLGRLCRQRPAGVGRRDARGRGRGGRRRDQPGRQPADRSTPDDPPRRCVHDPLAEGHHVGRCMARRVGQPERGQPVQRARGAWQLCHAAPTLRGRASWQASWGFELLRHRREQERRRWSW